MSASWGTCCCAAPDRESKLITVGCPWAQFYTPYINEDTHDYRYLVQTSVLINSTGTRTIVATYDQDSGAYDTDTTQDGGFDPAAAKGTLVSESVSETVDETIWTLASETHTLTGGVTLATQTSAAATYLQTLLAVEDAKEPLAITAWMDLGSGLEEVVAAWVFPSEIADYATLVPTADLAASNAVLIPNAVYPWDSKYVIADSSGTADWFYSHYGWPGGDTGLNATDPFDSPTTDPTKYWARRSAVAFTQASLSCHAFPSGIDCTTGDVIDVVISTTTTKASQKVTASDCASLTLSHGYYCFDWTGIYRPGNATPIAASWAEVTTPGWMVADEAGNGGFPTPTGPLQWEVACCP